MSRLPKPFIDRLEAQFGKPATDGILAAFKDPRRPTFRANALKIADDELMRLLREDGIQFERVKDVPHAFAAKNRTSPELLESYLAEQGKIYLQGIASMMPALVLDPKPGETVLDLCAAPGSKATQMAAMMEGRGRLVAVEEDPVRFQKLQNTVWIQGAKSVEARHADSTLLYHEEPQTYDKALADVPCSAEGRITLRDARSYSFWSQKNITIHAKLQRRLLRSAARCLKPGGTLVYSTCTLAPEENEEQVAWFRTEFPEFAPVDFDLPLSAVRRPGKGMAVVLPTKEHEGFFVAKLRKAA
ncbi:RsmB/NOP family class I SAM-dependent RNA methyltransferase [Patescibacteria group bacterium]|nr:MAG: RsmB/NOP family class I SAM-dependent RNA methyltransferase [Patescibacteria group bacterium]